LTATGPAPSPRTNTFALGKVYLLLAMSLVGLDARFGTHFIHRISTGRTITLVHVINKY